MTERAFTFELHKYLKIIQYSYCEKTKRTVFSIANRIKPYLNKCIGFKTKE